MRLRVARTAAAATRLTHSSAVLLSKPATSLNFNDTQAAFAKKSTGELLRAYLVFRLSSIRWLVLNAKHLLAVSNTVIGEGATTWLLKSTFFNHFCAGTDEQDIKPTLARLRSAGIGGILDYAAEKDVVEGTRSDRLTAEQEAAASKLLAQPLSPTAPAASTVASGAPARGYASSSSAASSSTSSPAAQAFAASEASLDRNLRAAASAVRAAQAESGFAAVKLTGIARPELLMLVSTLLHEHRRAFRALAAQKSGNPYLNSHISLDGLAKVLGSASAAEEAAAIMRGTSQRTSTTAPLDYLVWSDFAAASALLNSSAAGSESKLFHKLLSAAGINSPAALALGSREQSEWQAVLARADELASAASAARVTVMLDAEQSYMQPAEDLLAHGMMARYNKPTAGGVAAPGPLRNGRHTGGGYPVVYNTWQAYLRDTPSRLQLSIRRAQREGWLWGGKLVRGAYMLQERARARDMGYHDPIQPNIEATHAAYNTCADTVLQTVVAAGHGEIMIASHNEASIQHVIQHMANLGIQTRDGGVAFGQLLGMCDHVSYSLARSGYSVHKYVPYGPVQEVIPYLLRRAEENGDVLGGGLKEMRLIQAEVSRRLLSR